MLHQPVRGSVNHPAFSRDATKRALKNGKGACSRCCSAFHFCLPKLGDFYNETSIEGAKPPKLSEAPCASCSRCLSLGFEAMGLCSECHLHILVSLERQRLIQTQLTLAGNRRSLKLPAMETWRL